MRRQFLLFFLMLCCGSGCSYLPFEKTEYLPVSHVSPHEILFRQKAMQPEAFKIVNTVIFQYRTRKFISLGFLSIDTKDRSFELAGMNSMGIKLIEIATKNEEVIVNNVMKEISQRGDISKVLVKDIYRIYFDQMPSDDAEIQIKGKEIIFSDKNELGRIDYHFAGRENHLVEKTFYEGKKKRWAVKYYEYEELNGKIYPQGVIFSNYQYKYKLIITTKEIL